MSNFLIDDLQIELTWKDLLDNLPYSVGVKTQDSEFVAVNSNLAKLTGFKKPCEMIGLTDHELKCPAAQYSQLFHQQDLLALNDQEQKNLDICQYADNQFHVFISIKKKIVDFNSKSFIFFTMTELPVHPVLSIFKQSLYKINGSYSIQHPVVQEGKIKIKLTHRQEEVLFYLLQSKTMKQLSYLLKITMRAVEEHIKALKRIFNCQSKSQLIELAYFLGYAYIIPPSLFIF